MTLVELTDIRAGYTAEVLRGITTTFGAGELTALLGPSGCGKTTLLKVLAGLLPAAGHLRFDGDEIGPLPPEKREVAVVFQKPLLFPHLDVQGNVAFGLKMRGRAEDVTPMLALTGVESLARRRVSELSGGQEQRVALARALVTRPRLLLLDEPFSALDETLRAQMRTLVRRLQRELQTTTVFVTHDQEEASLVADRIVLLLDGRVEQAGAPAELYSRPATPAAARFFGWQLLGDGRAFRPEMAALHPDGGLPGAVRDVVRWARGTRYTIALDTGETVTVDEPGYPAEPRGRVHVRLLRYLEFS
jgi:ABC-type Fe3+/spermidine/putrescine transport system ATPase subunit